MDIMGAGKHLTRDECNRVRNVLREELKHTTQAELARRLGMRQQTVSATLASKFGPGIKFVYRLARALGTTTEAILRGNLRCRIHRHDGRLGDMCSARRSRTLVAVPFRYLACA